MRFGITDLAEILGITTSAIRYFEKEDLICVEKEKNGHRYYDEEDVFRLLSYAKYRSMEFPMKTIITQFSGAENNWKLIKNRGEKAKEEALKKAEYYNQLAKNIDDQLQSIALIDSLLGKYEFAKSPKIFMMQEKECGWISKNRKSRQIIKQWVTNMPAVQLAVLDTQKSEVSTGFAYMIYQKNPLAQELPMQLQVYQIPEQSCIHTIVKASEDFAYEPQKIFVTAKKYAQSRNLELKGQAWGKILLVEVEKGQRLHTYAEVWIPVC